MAKKRVFIVPKDGVLREDMSNAQIVIYTVRTKDGKEFDVCDYAYKDHPKMQSTFKKFLEEVELDVDERQPF